MLQLDTDWQYLGLQVLRLENDLLCIDVLPELGAKIYNFVHKPSGRNLLWHNPTLPPARQPYGAAYDDNWSGGWDELLPNDLPRPAPGGDLLPDHGEFWSQAAGWEVVTASPTRLEVRFTSYGRVLATRFEKTICLEAGAPYARLNYAYHNLGRTPIDFLWNIHPALAISADTWLDVPARQGITDAWREEQFPGGGQFHWPFASDRQGRMVDLREVKAADTGVADMHYLVDVEQGWYAATDREAGVGFALAFPMEVFPHVWLFRTFGGWRGLYTLILEASTGYPYDLDVARQNGTCAHLGAGETLTAEALAIAYAGIEAVSRVEADGYVEPGTPQA
jgi:hypothetical protein